MMTADPLLLLVDDDETFCTVLQQALVKRGFVVDVAHSIVEAEESLRIKTPDCAIVDLSMPNGNGLDLIPQLKRANPEMRMVVLTGYASIATAVEAIKLGASNYLTKPSDADQIVKALGDHPTDPARASELQPMTAERLEWEHIHKVLNDCEGNISRAARQLGMHRRTLQRKLQKRPSKLD